VSYEQLTADGPDAQAPGRFVFRNESQTTIAMKTTSIARKPRNPLVAAALQRKAGAHRRSPSGLRHRLRVALQREIQAAARWAEVD
jgi:hypothetical protein